MVDDLCDVVTDLGSQNEKLTEYIDAVGGAYRSQLAAAQRGALVPCLALGVAGTAYLLLTEAMGLNWSSALGTVGVI